MKTIIGMALICLGLVVVSWTAFKLIQQYKFVTNAIITKGMVTAINYSAVSRTQRVQDTESGVAGRVNTSNQTEIIQFTINGNTIELSSGSMQIGLGEEVELLYLPDDPQAAQVNNFFSLWGWIYIVGGFGIIFILIGVFLRIYGTSESPPIN